MSDRRSEGSGNDAEQQSSPAPPWWKALATVAGTVPMDNRLD